MWDFLKILSCSHCTPFPHCSRDTPGNALEGAGILLITALLNRVEPGLCNLLGISKAEATNGSWAWQPKVARLMWVLGAWESLASRGLATQVILSVAEAALPLLLSEVALVCQSGLATLGPDFLSSQESCGLTQVLDEKAFTAPNTF